MLGGDAQRLPTRREDADLPAPRHQRGDVPGCIDDLLEVVQKQEAGRAVEVICEHAVGPDCVRDRGQNESCIPNGREVDEPDAIREALRRLCRGSECEAGLADAAGTRDRHDARGAVAEKPQNVGKLLLAANQRVRRDRQVRTVETSERREVGCAVLEDALGRGEILEAVLAEVRELELDELRRGGRDKHLPAMACRCDAGGAVDVAADVALLGQDWRPRMQADPHPDRARGETLDERVRGGERGGRPREREEERVPLRIHLDPALSRARLPDHPPVLRQHLSVALGAELV